MKKISLPEIIIMVLIVGSYELFEAFAGLAAAVPGLGQILIVINFLGDWVIWLGIQAWLIMKGVKSPWYTIGSGIEFVPIADIFFWRTLGLITTIIIANRSAAPAPAEEQPTPPTGEELTEELT